MEKVRVDINPLLNILSRDMEMYTELFEKLNKLEWGFYKEEQTVRDLNIIRGMLDLKPANPKGEMEFAKLVGECGKKIMEETKRIREEVTKVLESIAKEEIVFGKEERRELEI